MDFLVTYDVPGVPDLQIGVTDTGQVGLVIATECALIADPAGLSAVQQVIEQAMTDQNRIYRERFLPAKGDYVRFCQGNPERTMLTGYVIRAPWGSKQQNVTIRTDEEPSRLFCCLTASVEIIRKKTP